MVSVGGSFFVTRCLARISLSIFLVLQEVVVVVSFAADSGPSAQPHERRNALTERLERHASNNASRYEKALILMCNRLSKPGDFFNLGDCTPADLKLLAFVTHPDKQNSIIGTAPDGGDGTPAPRRGWFSALLDQMLLNNNIDSNQHVPLLALTEEGFASLKECRDRITTRA